MGVTVSETQNPREVLPKAVNELIMRILIFYVGALIAIMAIVPGVISMRIPTLVRFAVHHGVQICGS